MIIVFTDAWKCNNFYPDNNDIMQNNMNLGVLETRNYMNV